MLTLHGEEVIPISKVVKELCLKQGNMKEQNIFQQLVYAREIWKELFRTTIWEIKNVVIELDCKKHTFCLPSDCERIVNISVIDHLRRIQPLTCDPSISTVEILCVKNKCSCKTCKGQDTLCSALDAVSYTTEMIEIQGDPYILETWTRYSNGAIQQEQKIPSYDTATDTVVYNTEITTLCNVEVTDKGCIKATDSNMALLRTYCGCGNFPESQCGVSYDWYRNNVNLIPQPYNYYGYWNANAEDRSIIHVFRHQNGLKQASEPNGIEKAILSYQTNGEEEDAEILIPQYAKFAIDMGVMWCQKLYNPRAGVGEKQYAEEKWRAAKQRVMKHLNPIRMEHIAKLQTQPRRW